MSTHWKTWGNVARSVTGAAWRLLRTSAFHRRIAIVSGVLLALTVALPAWRIAPIAGEKPYIPLHYNVYVGVDAFGAWYRVFVIPFVGALVLAANLAIAGRVHERERALAAFVAVAAAIVELILFVAMVLVVLLNLR